MSVSETCPTWWNFEQERCLCFIGYNRIYLICLKAKLDNLCLYIVLNNSQVVLLYKRKWIEETTYPHFTMIGQSLGSVYLAWEALCKFTPIYYFDTSGYAFTYPLARLFGCKVICYTHYPTISSDMLARVRQRSFMYNNDALITKRFHF